MSRSTSQRRLERAVSALTQAALVGFSMPSAEPIALAMLLESDDIASICDYVNETFLPQSLVAAFEEELKTGRYRAPKELAIRVTEDWTERSVAGLETTMTQNARMTEKLLEHKPLLLPDKVYRQWTSLGVSKMMSGVFVIGEDTVAVHVGEKHFAEMRWCSSTRGFQVTKFFTVDSNSHFIEWAGKYHVLKGVGRKSPCLSPLIPEAADETKSLACAISGFLRNLSPKQFILALRSFFDNVSNHSLRSLSPLVSLSMRLSFPFCFILQFFDFCEFPNNCTPRPVDDALISQLSNVSSCRSSLMFSKPDILSCSGSVTTCAVLTSVQIKLFPPCMRPSKRSLSVPTDVVLCVVQLFAPQLRYIDRIVVSVTIVI